MVYVQVRYYGNGTTYDVAVSQTLNIYFSFRVVSVFGFDLAPLKERQRITRLLERLWRGTCLFQTEAFPLGNDRTRLWRLIVK